MTRDVKGILAASLERPLLMGSAELVRELVEISGASLVAVIGRVTNTGTVRQWMEGEEEPGQLERLRLALQVALFIQAAGEDKEVVAAWMRGANRLLSDEAPALVIADAPLDVGQRDVMAAARAFLAR